MLSLMKQDVVLFPFPDADLNGGLGMEYMRTSGYGFSCLDAGDFGKRKAKTFKGSANMVVIAHGSDADAYKGLMQADTKTLLTVAGLAQMIGPSGFVKGFSNEIYIWSCKSGAAGGFAQQFAKAMVAYGVSQLKIYGCLLNTSPISRLGQLMVEGPRPATDADVVAYWGANL